MGHNIVPIYTSLCMSTLNMALLSIILTVAHVGGNPHNQELLGLSPVTSTHYLEQGFWAPL